MRSPHQPPPDPDTEIHVWDVAAGEFLHRLLSRGAGGANSVAFAPRGTALAAGYSDGKVRLWDSGTGRLTGTHGDDCATVVLPSARRYASRLRWCFMMTSVR